jgi:pyridinium-3,5-biscarboxylic acid mononucleotide synthase
MDSHELTQLLEGVRSGRITTTEASRKLRTVSVPIEEMGFARVDLHRRLRCGFPEVIFGQGKTAEQIEGILRSLLRHDQRGLVTRVEPSVAAYLKEAFPEGEHNPLGRTFRVGGAHEPG